MDRLHDLNYTLQQIADHLGRGMESVKAKRFRQRTKRIRNHYGIQRWSAVEESNLRSMYAQGSPLSEIAHALNRSNSSVNSKIGALGLAATRRNQ